MILGGNKTSREIDNYAINTLKIPSIVLMENAALSFVSHIKRRIGNILIICGKGNNGGDGYAIARQLHSRGSKVHIYCISNKNMSIDCQINYEICKNLGIDIHYDIEELDNLLLNCNLIIDSIFGTGLNSEITGLYREIIEKVNRYSYSKEIYSVDIPSGIDGNTGKILGIAVKANKTVSFITYKKAFLNLENRDYFGEIIIENIGLNEEDIFNLTDEYYITEKSISKCIIGRHEDSHKGDFGKILIFSGSKEFSGASVITANSCVRAGAGLTTLMTYNNTFSGNISSLPEVMLVTINHININEDLRKIEEVVLNSDVIAIGPGIGRTFNSLTVMKKILSFRENNKGNIIKLVIDADGLNLLSENPELFELIRNRAILTPHIIEFSRLSGLTPQEIAGDRLNGFALCRKFSEKFNIILILKGKNTLITDGSKIYINSTGNSHMANGGMGDCLTGITASLLGQGYSLIDSSKIAVFLHGYIGDRVFEKQYIVNATHIIDNISAYMKEIFKLHIDFKR